MKRKHITTKKKIINHLMVDGKKHTSENIFLKSFKELQRNSTKQTKKLLQLCVINSAPVFKLQESSNKKIKKSKRKVKITPVFINKLQSRTSLGMKLFLFYLKKIKSSSYFYQKLANEILLIAFDKGTASEMRKETHKKVVINKRYIKHYRW